MTNRIGDRPRFPLTNQRFDKGDAENIARYYEEIISRFTGSIYGQAWGCVSSPGFSVVPIVISGSPTQYHLQFSRSALLFSVPVNGNPQAPSIDQGPWQATLAVYDPDKEGQDVQSLILNSFATAQSRPWVLFRRREKPTALGNKAYWDTSTNTERTGSANLEQTEYVEFLLSTSYSLSDTEAGWYRMAYIDSWTGTGASATPVIVPIHWMDSQHYADATPPVQGTRVGSALAFPSDGGSFNERGFNPYNEMPNLAKMLHWIVGKLGEHYSTTNTVQVTPATQAAYNLKPGAFVLNSALFNDGTGWLSSPTMGLVELTNDVVRLQDETIPGIDSSLGTIEASLSSFYTKYLNTTRLLHVMYVTPVQGETSAWTDFTFDVRVTSLQEGSSFAPRIGPWADASATVRYAFTPQILGGTEGRYILLQLAGATTQPAVQTYEISSVNITANEDPMIGVMGSWSDLIVQQRYQSATGPVVLPPATLSGTTELRVFFVVQSIEDDEGKQRPFTVHIYGRNI